MCQSTDHEKLPGAAVLPATIDRTCPLFPLGKVVATPAALAHLEKHNLSPFAYLSRHQRGDWGSVSADDALENQLSVLNGSRILSRYEIAGQPLWIITEADRSSSCILRPEDY